jgi:hypothetical protein
VIGFDFAPVTTIDLSINGVPVAEAPTTDEAGGFVYQTPDLDLQSKDVVAVSDGSVNLSLTLVGLTFDVLDYDLDSASGTTDQPPGTEVVVSASNGAGAGEELTIPSGSEGRWNTGFTIDLTPEISVSAFVFDSDLDGATVAEQPVPAQLQASTEADPSTGSPDFIAGLGFAPDTEISLVIREAVVSEPPTTDESGSFVFDHGGTLDLRPGDRVVASDGVTVRRLTVVALTFDDLDYAGDGASGTSDQPDGTPVSVSLSVDSGSSERVDASIASGQWSAAFIGDVTTESRGDAVIFDSDWDLTLAASPPPPQVQASMANSPANGSPDIIAGYGFAPGVPTAISINGEGVSDSPTTDADGSFLYAPVELDLRSGAVVIVETEAVTKSLTLVSLTLDSIDYVSDTAAGSSDQPDGTIVQAAVDDGEAILEYAIATVEWGAWEVSFTSDVEPDLQVRAAIFDRDEDLTIAVAPPPPVIQASMANDPAAAFPAAAVPDQIAGERFAANTQLSVSVNGVPVDDPPWTDDSGSFRFEPDEFDLLVGDVVEVSDGQDTKTVTLVTLTFDVLASFTAAGTSDQADGTRVYVHVGFDDSTFDGRTTVNGSAWSLEISLDLRFALGALAGVIDQDGDQAVAPFNFPPPARPSDFDGDGTTDLAVFRKGAWFIEGMPARYLGLPGDLPVPADYDGSQSIDIAVFRQGAWLAPAQPTMYYGLPGDIPVPGDYLPDDRAERGVYRRGTWFLTGVSRAYVGLEGDVPVPADYDGDRRHEPAIFRDGRWYIADHPVWLPGQDQGIEVVYWGLPGDIPVPGDYDGDTEAEPAVFREGRWYIVGQPVVFWGLPGDVPVPGDYDGDGDVEPAVYRDGQWHVYGQPTRYWGLPGDIPLALPAAIYSAHFSGSGGEASSP